MAFVRHAVAGATIAAGIVANAGAVAGLSQTANGLVFYYGVVPTEVVRGHPRQHAERLMHGGGEGRHIVLAIFDAGTGERVVRADVRATVSMAGAFQSTKQLEPMPIAGAATFGNYFSFSPPGMYSIRFTVRREGHRPATADFEYVVPPP